MELLSDEEFQASIEWVLGFGENALAAGLRAERVARIAAVAKLADLEARLAAVTETSEVNAQLVASLGTKYIAAEAALAKAREDALTMRRLVAEAVTKVTNDRTLWTPERQIWLIDANAALIPAPAASPASERGEEAQP